MGQENLAYTELTKLSYNDLIKTLILDKIVKEFNETDDIIIDTSVVFFVNKSNEGIYSMDFSTEVKNIEETKLVGYTNPITYSSYGDKIVFEIRCNKDLDFNLHTFTYMAEVDNNEGSFIHLVGGYCIIEENIIHFLSDLSCIISNKENKEIVTTQSLKGFNISRLN